MYSLPQDDLKQILTEVRGFWPRKKNILITGGTGFFGRWIIEAITFIESELNCKNIFIVTSRQDAEALYNSIPSLKNSFFKLLQTELDIRFQINEALDYVIHAASDVAKIKNNTFVNFETTVEMTKNVIRAASIFPLEKFLYISSGGVYNDLGKPVAESDLNLVVEKNINSYAAAKRQSEILINGMSKSCSARCFSFVGPYCDQNMAIMQMLSQKSITVRSPKTVRSYMYPTDLVISLFKLLFLPNTYQVYNVGSDQPISLLELAHKISDQVSVGTEDLSDPKSLAGQYYCPSTQRFDREYGRGLTVELDEALRRTRQYLNVERKAI